ncbi:MAG: archaellin/type IV pilin N-terminal domain-containing protein [Infirmifilum sp.]
MTRKAVSPVIATLLLIVIAVAAAVLTYVWVTGYMGTLAPRQTPTQLQERIKIDAVSVSGTTVSIYVSNIGDVNANVISAYVLTTNSTVVCGGSLTKSTSIPPGQVTQVTVPTSCGLTSGTTYVAKVSTQGGTEATYVFKA